MKLKASLKTARAVLLSLDLRRTSHYLSPEDHQAAKQLSIIVPICDSPAVLRRCLESLERWGWPAEIILVDDGSQLAETKAVIADYLVRNPWKLYADGGPARGHSRATESGVRMATRPILCLLNSDTVVTPYSWAGMARAFWDPEVAVAGPSTSRTAGPQSLLVPRLCSDHWTNQQIYSYARQYAARWHWDSPIRGVNFVGGFAFFVRREVWDKLGGFDLRLPDYGNEKEFCLRVLAGHYRIAWSQAAYIHHLSGQSYSASIGRDQIRQRSEAADRYIADKHSRE